MTRVVGVHGAQGVASAGAELEPSGDPATQLVDDGGTWPTWVRRWTNITAVNDPVATTRPRAPVVPGVFALAVDDRAHEPAPFLCPLACGRAIEGLL